MKVMMRRLVAPCAIVIALVVCSLLADEAPKPAWEWTDRDRLAARQDVAAAAARRRAAEDADPQPQSANLPRLADVISGKRDPQLLLPYELFDQLVTTGFADDETARLAFRQLDEPHRKRLFLPDDFWLQLESIVAPYRATQLRHRQHATTSQPLPDDPVAAIIAVDICRDRFAALTAARTQFGPAFDRFLYEAVAPSMTVFVIRPPDVSRKVEVSEGCQ